MDGAGVGVAPGRASGRWHAAARWLVGALFIAGLAWLPATAGQQDGVIRVLLRYDDYTRDSSLALEKELLLELRQLGVPLFVGVVPFLDEPYPEQSTVSNPPINLGPDKIALLRESLASGAVEVALHGFNHQTNFMIDGRPSEFAGLPLARQRQLLAAGKASLERTFGNPVRVFTPPFNVFDGTTVTAMEQVGFQILSAGVSPIGGNSPLFFVPGTTYPQRMREAVEAARLNRSANKLIVVVMHPYDFTESDDPIPAFRTKGAKIRVADFLADVRWAMAQPGVRFVSISDELANRSDLSAARVSANFALEKSWVRSLGLTSSSTRAPAPEGFLLPRADAVNMRWRDYLLALGIHGGFTLLAYALSRGLNRIRAVAARRSLQRRLLAALGAIVAGFGYLRGFYLLKTLCLVSAFGWFLGTLSVGAGWFLRRRLRV